MRLQFIIGLNVQAMYFNLNNPGKSIPATLIFSIFNKKLINVAKMDTDAIEMKTMAIACKENTVSLITKISFSTRKVSFKNM